MENTMTDLTYPSASLFIGGRWISPELRSSQPIICPANGLEIGQIANATPEDLEYAVISAASAFASWRSVSPVERSAILRRFAELLRRHEEEIAGWITRDEGKPRGEALAEVRSSADHVDWHAEEGRRIYGRTIPARQEGVRQYVVREPVGVCLAITPWNFPLSQAVRKVAAALAAGCTVILKGPSDAPSGVIAIGRYLQEAGLPDGCLNLVWGAAGLISSTLVAHPDVRKVSFTGSVGVGKILAELAGRHMKRTTMELGGHAPVLIFDDTNVQAAAAALTRFKLRNAGQVCISPTRFFVQHGARDRFLDALSSEFSKVNVGPGSDPASEMGPLCHERRVGEMERLIGDAEQRGANIVSGGKRIERDGYFFSPTIVWTESDEIALMHEEPFGPIAVVSTFNDLEDGLSRANALPFGLASYVFTTSLARAERASAELAAGMVSINHFGLALPETPFSGIHDSGHGVEGGSETFDGYLNTKFVSQRAWPDI